jgi:hypothetical protein
MSTVLEILQPATHSLTPRVRVRCAGCGRHYVTTQTVADIRRRRHCSACFMTYRARLPR